MTIAIALPTLVEGDAVGNDVFGMTRVLRDQGHDVQLVAWYSRVNEPVRNPEELPKMLNRPEDVLIYHHSIGCEWAVKAIEKLRCRKIVKYHNVTPPKFFADLNAEVAKGCQEGLDQLPRLVRANPLFWADSEFNSADLRALRAKHVTVLPPFHQAEQLLEIEADRHAVNGLDDWGTNILVVGRLVPNKNIALAVQAFAIYKRQHNPLARLVIVGDRPVPSHAVEIEKLIQETGFADSILITGKVTTSQLKALYLTSDALLVTSLHEGFCVPLIEAMGLMLPIVAVPNAAIPGTGGDAILTPPAEPEAIARELSRATLDADLRQDLIARGRKRYLHHFENTAIRRQFLRLIESVIEGRTPFNPRYSVSATA
jgi:glycosyltransferase involved in cell wall biosynthesis